jgi:hypothetical protein
MSAFHTLRTLTAAQNAPTFALRLFNEADATDDCSCLFANPSCSRRSFCCSAGAQNAGTTTCGSPGPECLCPLPTSTALAKLERLKHIGIEGDRTALRDRDAQFGTGEQELLIYWALFAYFAVAALLERPNRTQRGDPALWLGGILVTLLIGLRFHVGADWIPYVAMFEYSERISLASTATLNDPGYFALNWLVHQLGGDFWLVNTICASIFSFGLIKFAETQERPRLTVLVGVPYLIIVVAMGYTRQSVSIGIILAGLATYQKDQSTLKLAIYFLAASYFHKTALFAFPLICLGSSRRIFLNALAATAITYFLYNFFLSGSLNNLVHNYVDRAYSSRGAGVRIAMNIVPAVIFFINRKNFNFTDIQYRIWRNYSVASLGLLVTLLVLPSSTLVDRLALYVIPLQLAILPQSWKGRLTDRFGVTAVISYSALVQFFWLNFAVHARFWVPYRLWPFE